MHRFLSVLPIPVFVSMLLFAGGPRPAGAQPNVVSLELASDVFEVPYTVRKIHFHVEEDMSKASGDSLRVRRVQTYNEQVLEKQSSSQIKLGDPEFQQLLVRLGLVKIRRSFDRKRFDPSAPNATNSPREGYARIYYFVFRDSTGAKEFVEQAEQMPEVVSSTRLNDVEFGTHSNSLAVPPEEENGVWENNLWYLKNDYQFSTRAEDAWKLMNDVSRTNTGNVRIGVVDLSEAPDGSSGSLTEVGHPDLVDNLLGLDYDTPFHQHPMLMASIISAETNNGQGTAGITYNSRVEVLVADSENGTTMDKADRIASAIDDAKELNSIVNMSWKVNSDLEPIRKAIDFAHGTGTFLVASVGNDGNKIDAVWPASYDEVVGVSATDRSGSLITDENGNLATNWGGPVDLAAPGEDIVVLGSRSNTTGCATCA